jgi:hypothetical protein
MSVNFDSIYLELRRWYANRSISGRAPIHQRISIGRINADYPAIAERGSFPVNRVAYGPAFRVCLDELKAMNSECLREKFQIDLSGRSTTTVRGWCGTGDGKIHTDSLSKIITVLIYINPSWEEQGGRLRLLRSGNDLNDVLVEVPPVQGTLLAFKRAENSWHGHEPFVGARRVIQFNWVTSEGDRQIALLRHHASASAKRILARILPARH